MTKILRTGVASAAFLALFVILGCSPTVNVEIRAELPSSVASPNRARLHVRGRVLCNDWDQKAAPPTPPPPGLEETDPFAEGRGSVRVTAFDREGMIAKKSFRASHCSIAVTAFYDTNGDGIPNVGDFVGTIPATDIADHGIFSGNDTKLTVKLAPFSASAP